MRGLPSVPAFMMAEAMVKRALEDGDDPVPKRLHEDPEDLRSHLENLTLFAGIIINAPVDETGILNPE